jgi:hypothetical protein
MSSLHSLPIIQPSLTTFQLLEEQHLEDHCCKVALDFLATTPCLPYGYRYNGAEILGTYLLSGGAVAINWLRKERSDLKHLPLAIYKIAAVIILIVTLPFSLLGAAIKWSGSLALHSYQELKDIDVPATSKETIDQIYEILHIFSGVAKEEGLEEWFLYSGSALGEYVRNGVIPWDDDGDIAVLNTSKEKLLGIENKLNERGLYFDRSLSVLLLEYFTQENHFTLRLDSQIAEARLGYKPSRPAMVDIFFLSENTREIDGTRCSTYFFEEDVCRRLFPYEYLRKEELFDDQDRLRIEKRLFGPPCADDTSPSHSYLMVNCLRKESAKDYLLRTYGPTCLEKGRTSHQHFFICGIPLPGMPVIPIECTNTPGHYANGWKWQTTSIDANEIKTTGV